jgi:hypothetical protein
MEPTRSRRDDEAAESSGGPEFAGEVVLTEAQLTALEKAGSDKEERYETRMRRAIYLSGRET